MIAYNKKWLDNLRFREQIENAFYLNAISKEEKENAEMLYPVSFYMPNPYIRAGLFILTVIIASFSFGLLALLFLGNIDRAYGTLIIFTGLVSYACLEFFVQRKSHYRSGVDDSLLWISGICIAGGLNAMMNISASGNALLIFILSTFFFLRFTDMVMSVIAAVSFLALCFFQYSRLGNFAEATTSFLLMVFAAGIYFFAKKLPQRKKFRFYSSCRAAVEIIMLFCFYVAANYFTVREMSNTMFNLSLKDNESIPYAWLFWGLTILIPCAYIVRGLQIRDRVLIRVGLILVAAMVFTVRYYHSAFPPEVAMVSGGFLLIIVSYIITKYLAVPKKGFTSKEIAKKFSSENTNAESLAIAETFGRGPIPASHTNFGGGSFGGGGASGEF